MTPRTTIRPPAITNGGLPNACCMARLIFPGGTAPVGAVAGEGGGVTGWPAPCADAVAAQTPTMDIAATTERGRRLLIFTDPILTGRRPADPAAPGMSRA